MRYHLPKGFTLTDKPSVRVIGPVDQEVLYARDIIGANSGGTRFRYRPTSHLVEFWMKLSGRTPEELALGKRFLAEEGSPVIDCKRCKNMANCEHGCPGFEPKE
ncbi:MAG TPA: hypothetical protein VI911_09775 [Patescibacteria group bacterium]|nr:hypothetical protein [Patescibacteria group bacterium]